MTFKKSKLCFFHSGAQPILYPAESLTAYHGGRSVHTGQGLARLGPYSTVGSGYQGLAAPSGTLSAAAVATTAGTLQPLSHIPSAQSSQFHYIANTGAVQQQHHTHSVASPGSHSFGRSGYSGQAMNLQYIPAQPSTLQLQPSVTVGPSSYNIGYTHSPVISTSAPAYTQHQPQLPTIHPVTGTAAVSIQQTTLPTFSAPDTFSSPQLPPPTQQVTQHQQTRPHWSGY